MKLAILLLALVRCTPAEVPPPAHPPPEDPPPVVVVTPPAPETDAGSSSMTACRHLGTFPCRSWYPEAGGQQACVDGLNVLVGSQTVKVDRTCLARVKSCAEAAGCVK